jgi:uncharacterized membrane protein
MSKRATRTSIILAGVEPEEDPMWTYYWAMPWMFGPVIMLLFAIACMAMMFFAMRGRSTRSHDDGRPMEILKERYARGEITQAELEERRRLLGA